MNRFEPLLRGQFVFVAVFRDPGAAHQFHHEIGPAGLGRAGIEHLRDVRMVHHRQRLALRFEPGDHLLRVHAQLDDFERDAAAHRFLLLGHVDDAAAAFADFLKNFVTANPVAGLFSQRQSNGAGCVCKGRRFRGFGKKSTRLLMRSQQPFDPASEHSIRPANFIEKARARDRVIAFERLVKQRLQRLVRRHQSPLFRLFSSPSNSMR